MKQEIENNLLADCFKAAMNVEFLYQRRDKVMGLFPV